MYVFGIGLDFGNLVGIVSYSGTSGKLKYSKERIEREEELFMWHKRKLI